MTGAQCLLLSQYYITLALNSVAANVTEMALLEGHLQDNQVNNLEIDIIN